MNDCLLINSRFFTWKRREHSLSLTFKIVSKKLFLNYVGRDVCKILMKKSNDLMSHTFIAVAIRSFLK